MQWFNMHGYALYVWSAYGIVAVVLSLQVISVKLYAKKVRGILRAWVK